MTNSQLCEELRNTLIEHEIGRQKTIPPLFDARKLVENITNKIKNLKQKIMETENRAKTIMSIPQNRTGALISMLNSVHAAARSEVELNKLRTELNYAEQELRRAEANVLKLEQDLRGYEYNIPYTKEEMRRNGCELP